MSSKTFNYRKITHGISVSVNPFFLDDESQPEKNYYVWAYQILIENLSDSVIQILSRHWTITDGWCKVQNINGEGVVGQQPVLKPGDSFEYTSTIPLSTSNGFMTGSYEIVQKKTHVLFEVEIPLFSLDCPLIRYAVN